MAQRAKRCDICYGTVLGHIINLGRLPLIGRVRLYRPLNDDIYKPDMARSLPQLATKRHPSTLLDLADGVAL